MNRSLPLFCLYTMDHQQQASWSQEPSGRYMQLPRPRASALSFVKFEAAKRHPFLTLFWCARMSKISSRRSLRTNLGAITSTCSLPLILSENLSSFSSCPWSSRQRASYTRPSTRQCCTSEIPRWLSSASDVLSRGACINIKSKQNEKTNCIVWL